MSDVSLTEVAAIDLLRRYRHYKDQAQLLRGDLVRMCVEVLGIEQEKALKGDPESFVQGYVAGLRLQRREAA